MNQTKIKELIRPGEIEQKNRKLNFYKNWSTPNHHVLFWEKTKNKVGVTNI